MWSSTRPPGYTFLLVFAVVLLMVAGTTQHAGARLALAADPTSSLAPDDGELVSAQSPAPLGRQARIDYLLGRSGHTGSCVQAVARLLLLRTAGAIVFAAGGSAARPTSLERRGRWMVWSASRRATAHALQAACGRPARPPRPHRDTDPPQWHAGSGQAMRYSPALKVVAIPALQVSMTVAVCYARVFLPAKPAIVVGGVSARAPPLFPVAAA
jgi:hypothetical protein